MGGRITSFLGGVLLTLSATYCTGEYLNKNKEFVSNQLRTANGVINNRILTDRDIARENVPISKQIDGISRADNVETFKDIWNNEVINFVNWIYSINWYDLGIKIDSKLYRLFSSLTEKKSEKESAENKNQ